MRRGWRVAARWGLVLCLVAASVYSLVLARAALLFREDTAASVAAAVGLVPYNSEYVRRLSEWRPAEKLRLLERAVELDPFDYQAWIQLGFAAEFEHRDVARAERCYQQAAAVNHMYLPRWTLANFYFRQGRAEEFFRWAGATLAMTPYSPDPVFAAMWQLSQDSNRLAEAIPERPRILLQYALYLSGTGRGEAIPPIVQRLIRAVRRQEADEFGRNDLLPGIEDRLLESGEVQAAQAVWKSLREAGWIRQNAPDAGHPLTNGEFRVPFLGHGFDWRVQKNPGIDVEQEPDQGALRVRFSGDETESAELMQQCVPIAAGRTYRLRWSARASGMEAPSGLAWHLRAVRVDGREAKLASGDVLGSSGQWDFQLLNSSDEYVLSLQFTRALGQTRPAGEVVLTSVSLEER